MQLEKVIVFALLFLLPLIWNWYFRLYRAEIAIRARGSVYSTFQVAYTIQSIGTRHLQINRQTHTSTTGEGKRRLRDPRLLCKYRCSLARREALLYFPCFFFSTKYFLKLKIRCLSRVRNQNCKMKVLSSSLKLFIIIYIYNNFCRQNTNVYEKIEN